MVYEALQYGLGILYAAVMPLASHLADPGHGSVLEKVVQVRTPPRAQDKPLGSEYCIGNIYLRVHGLSFSGSFRGSHCGGKFSQADVKAV